MIKCYFITGTDTGIGKTITSVALLQAGKNHDYIVAGYKPVASGSKIVSERLYNNDALLLQKNSSLKLNYYEVNPYTFLESTSPHIASIEEHKPIDFAILSAGLHALKRKADLIFVEGAGGWFTPLSEQQTFADWVILEKLSIILVVGIRSGCINHAMLTYHAITLAKLHLAGWVANSLVLPDKWYSKYIATLKRLFPSPLLGEIPWFEKDIYDTNIGRYINFTALYNIPFVK